MYNRYGSVDKLRVDRLRQLKRSSGIQQMGVCVCCSYMWVARTIGRIVAKSLLVDLVKRLGSWVADFVLAN